MTFQEKWENHYAETAYGVLHGNEKNGLHQFLGVPYAAPPVGALRFRKPVPPAKWVGIREATQYSACALQPSAMFQDAYAGEDFNGRQGAEDCLYLNIWSPAKSPDEKLPVLVWVHGGGMMFGTAMSPYTDGDYIASHGAVVVTINYRLRFLLPSGALGRIGGRDLRELFPLRHPPGGALGEGKYRGFRR